jgi:uncharacterized membrane protein YfcA
MHVAPGELVACLLIVVVGAVGQGSGGFGGNLVVGPVGAVLVPEAVPGALVLVSLPLTVTMVVREHHHVDRRGVAWVMLGRLPGAAIGAAVVVLVAQDVLTIIIGVAIVVAVGLSLTRLDVKVSPASATTAGLSAGIMGTAAGVDGPPLALLYQHHHGEAIRATLAACFVLGTIMSAGALAIAGEIGVDQVLFSLAMMPALIVGLVASTWGARHLRGRSIRPYVLGFAGIAGVVAIVNGLT